MARAKAGLKATSKPHQQLTQAQKKDSVEQWHRQAEEAQALRGEALEIYDIQFDKGAQSSICIKLHLTALCW
jgi:hypothetical protein